jgi:ribosomal-protein-alanine N-acetyltransferase
VGGRAGGQSLNELRTDRLRLGSWLPEHRAAYAALNADPETMEFFPSMLTREQSDAMVDGYEVTFERHGFGIWSVTTVDGAFIGAVGLLPVGTDMPFGPTVEVGWRLARDQWGQGYATEAARAAIDWGFSECELPEIVAFTSVVNLRSRAVMERLGMHHDPAEDFLHPRVASGHHLQPHVLYRLRRTEIVA